MFFLEFPQETNLVSLGVFLLWLGGVTTVIGIVRFIAMSRKLARVYAVMDEELEG
ncbi:MAG TPA: hypothetical protein VIR77_02740 [Pontiella sp.]